MENDKAALVCADTGRVESAFENTFAKSPGDKTAGAFHDHGPGKEKTIRALTGNFYRATPCDDAEDSDSEKTGIAHENVETPFERANIEPAKATDSKISCTRARERGSGEIPVRGMGVRVIAAVVAPNGHRLTNEDTKATPMGGESITRHIEVVAPTIGFR